MGLANSSWTCGGREFIRLMYAAMAHISLSVFHLPLANMPVLRMPWLMTQKICASVYSVPTSGNWGTGGNKTCFRHFPEPQNFTRALNWT